MKETLEVIIKNLVDNIPVQDEVTDQEFENALDKEGFPESYKRILRYLHNLHPNWSFRGMQTGEDFNYAADITFETVCRTIIEVMDEVNF